MKWDDTPILFFLFRLLSEFLSSTYPTCLPCSILQRWQFTLTTVSSFSQPTNPPMMWSLPILRTPSDPQKLFSKNHTSNSFTTPLHLVDIFPLKQSAYGSTSSSLKNWRKQLVIYSRFLSTPIRLFPHILRVRLGSLCARKPREEIWGTLFA